MSDREFVLATIFVVSIIVLVILVGVIALRIWLSGDEDNPGFGLSIVERAVNIVNFVLLRLGRNPRPSEENFLNNAAAYAVEQGNQVVLGQQVQAHTHQGAAHTHAQGAHQVQPAGAVQPAAGQPVVGQVQITITGHNLGVVVDGNQVVNPPNP